MTSEQSRWTEFKLREAALRLDRMDVRDTAWDVAAWVHQVRTLPAYVTANA